MTRKRATYSKVYPFAPLPRYTVLDMYRLKQELYYLLDLKLDQAWRNPLLTKILRGILNTIVLGLKRDGRVIIMGFGTFYIKTYPSSKHRVVFFTKPGQKKPIGQVVTLPERKVVKFKPAKALKRMLNESSA